MHVVDDLSSVEFADAGGAAVGNLAEALRALGFRYKDCCTQVPKPHCETCFVHGPCAIFVRIRSAFSEIYVCRYMYIFHAYISICQYIHICTIIYMYGNCLY